MDEPLNADQILEETANPGTVNGSNLLEPLAPERPDNLFTEVQQPTSELGSGRLNTDAVRRRASQGAFALTESTGEDYIARLEANTAALQDLIQANGDAELRAKIADQQRDRNVQGYIGDISGLGVTDPTGEERGRAMAAVQYELALAQEQRAQYALEQETVSNIRRLAANGSSTEAALLIDMMERGTVFDQMNELEAKRLIIQNAIDAAQDELDARPNRWGLLTGLDMLSYIPFLNRELDRNGLVDIPDSLKNWYDWAFAGERNRNEVAELYNMPLGEFATYVNETLIPRVREKVTLFGGINRTQEVEVLSTFRDTPSALEANALAVLDYSILPVGKMTTSTLSMMSRLGARSSAVDVLANFGRTAARDGTEAAARATGLTVEEGTDAMAVTAVRGGATITDVPLALDVDRAMRGERILSEALDGAPASAGRLTEEEVAAARQSATEAVQREFNQEVKDVVPERVVYADGRFTDRVAFTLGRKNGGGFANEGTARGRATSLGLTEGRDFTIITDADSGQLFLRVVRDMPEDGFVVLPIPGGATNAVSRFALGGQLISDRTVHAAGVLAGDRSAKLKTVLEGAARTTFRRLRGKERQYVSGALDHGHAQRFWFDQDSAAIHWRTHYGREITRREMDALWAAQNINDVEYALRNIDARIALTRRGFRHVDMETGRGTYKGPAEVVDIPDNFPDRVFDINTGEHILEMTAERAAALRAEGYQLIKPYEAVDLADQTTIGAFIAKRGTVPVGNLPNQVIGYVAGGHRIADPTYVTHFLRQTRRGMQADTSLQFLRAPKTYAGGTEAEMKWLAARLERGRQLYNEARTPVMRKVGKRGGLRKTFAMSDQELAVRLDEVFEGHAGLPEPEDFIRGMDGYVHPDGKWRVVYQKDEPFVVNGDRVLPDEYNRTDISRFADVDEGGTLGLLRSTGKLYYSKRGSNPLPGFNGEPARVLDAYSAIGRSIGNSIGLSSFGDYKIEMIERWLKTYKDIFDVPANSSPARQFLEASPRVGADHRIVNAGQANRDAITRTLRWQTELDREATQQQARFNAFLLGDDPNAARHTAGIKVASWLHNADPIESIRSFASHIKLGMFNPGQFLLQTGTMIASTSMSPKYGLLGMESVGWIKHAMGKLARNVPVNYDDLAQRLMLKSPEEAKAYLATIKNSGFLDVNTHTMMDQLGSGSVVNQTGNLVGDIADRGMFFFNEAERWNRLTAFRIAWGETVERFGANAYDSTDFQRFLAQRRHDYSFNMTQASASWWQRGVLKIPTQFWGYNARMLEAAMGNTFTRAQRIRLVLGQLFFWGAAGTPPTMAILEAYRTMTGNDPDLGTVQGFVGRGVVDNLLYLATGSDPEESWDLQVGARMGTGGWLNEVVKQMFNTSSYGPTSTVDFITGASAGILGDVTTSAAGLIKYIAAESGETSKPLTERALMGLADNISTVSNIHKAWLVWNLGVYESRVGNTLLDDLPRSEAFAVALGLSPGEMNDLGAKMSNKKERSKVVKEMASVIGRYRMQMVNDKEHAEEINERINAYVRLIPPELREDVMSRVRKETPNSLYDSVTESWERDLAEAQAARKREEQSGKSN